MLPFPTCKVVLSIFRLCARPGGAALCSKFAAHVGALVPCPGSIPGAPEIVPPIPALQGRGNASAVWMVRRPCSMHFNIAHLSFVCVRMIQSSSLYLLLKYRIGQADAGSSPAGGTTGVCWSAPGILTPLTARKDGRTAGKDRQSAGVAQFGRATGRRARPR